ncbi:MAG: hypothetical protein A3H93_05435 [Rhodocyclales bacterium RIFCSPLOWO2_02_FULL_63_24]|nr:MAG: hypothetical protein A2040_19460 [Rhodocyclales bacterium GWA2_65_19]OHC70780.1 MAG: hypothetical protein A3H93_05435 [Rhodocyclales bacterium RIFCSPLOWO2_02_FULL_63_24]
MTDSGAADTASAEFALASVGKFSHLQLSDLITAVGYLPIGLSITDSDVRISYWNDAFLKILDLPEDLLLGHRSIADVFRYNAARGEYGPGDIEEMVNARIALVMRFEAHEFIRPSKGGRVIRVSGRPILGADGQPIGIVSLYQDITVEKTYERNLEARNLDLEAVLLNLSQTQSKLIQSEKLASVGQLAAGVAHEINTPIGFVQSNLGSLEGYVGGMFRLLDAYEALEQQVSSQPELLVKARELKREIDLAFLREDVPALVRESRDGLTRVGQIVQALREFSQVDASGGLQQWDVNRSLQAAISLCPASLLERAKLVTDLQPLPLIECMPGQLNHVFLSLLTNAFQAIDKPPGTVTVRSRELPNGICIEIADTGTGIAPENLKKLFDPFFTTKPVGQGAGLGLSLAYGILRSQGGQIEVQSEPGQGATFRVVLPQSARGAAAE